MKQEILNYLQGKATNGVTHIAITTSDGIVHFLPLKADTIATIADGNYCREHDGIRLKAVKSNTPNLEWRKLFAKADFSLGLPNGVTQWQFIETFVAEMLNGQVDGGVSDSPWDVSTDTMKIEVKGVGGKLTM